jgi:DNA-3-methyladenine glycosylase II
VSFLDRKLDDCMHRVSGTTVIRLLPGGQPLILEPAESDDSLLYTTGAGTQESAEAFIREWLDTDRDLSEFYALLRQDPDLASLADTYRGFHLVGIPDLFECLVWCIMGQQINLQFAYTIKRRFVEAYGRVKEVKGEKLYTFPPAEIIAHTHTEELRAMQLTGRKCDYIRGVARAIADGEISKQQLAALTEGEALQKLTLLHGVGEWTANYVLMKSLRKMNCVPWGDIGIHQALNRLKGIPLKGNRRQIEDFFAAFEGWKTYMVYYLWRILR